MFGFGIIFQNKYRSERKKKKQTKNQRTKCITNYKNEIKN